MQIPAPSAPCWSAIPTREARCSDSRSSGPRASRRGGAGDSSGARATDLGRRGAKSRHRDSSKPTGSHSRAHQGRCAGPSPPRRPLQKLDTGDLPMPKARQRAVIGLARALAEGSIDLSPGADRHAAERGLLTLPGIGGWTAAYVRMRGLGDPDALLAADLGVRRAFEAHGLPGDPRSVTSRAEGWRPGERTH